MIVHTEPANQQIRGGPDDDSGEGRGYSSVLQEASKASTRIAIRKRHHGLSSAPPQ